MEFALILLAVLTLIVNCAAKSKGSEFIKGNHQFTANLYNEVLKVKPNTNFIFSPFSIQVILALTRAGAKGKTANELSNALKLPNQQATEQALKQLLSKFKKPKDDVELLSANRLFLGQKFHVLDAFKKLAIGTFDADIENVDFGKNEEAAQTINQWVEKQTNNKIKNLIDPSAINKLTRLILVNALYLHGKWVKPFEYRTQKEKFYVTKSQTKEVDMMKVINTFRYTETSNAQILELPYLGANISMIVVLPNEDVGLAAIEKNLEAVLAPQNLKSTLVSVEMPTFVIDSDLQLKPILKNLGLKTIFTNSANLKGISNESLQVDDVVHKAFINVTTSGTEAAAATGVQTIVKSGISLPGKVFIANRPFLYFITCLDDVILFSGKYAGV